MDRFIEAADWIVWQLTGVETRNSCTAGYKEIWSKRDGYPPEDFFCRIGRALRHVVDEKLSRTITFGEKGRRNHPKGRRAHRVKPGDGGSRGQRGRPCMRAGGGHRRAG